MKSNIGGGRPAAKGSLWESIRAHLGHIFVEVHFGHEWDHFGHKWVSLGCLLRFLKALLRVSFSASRGSLGFLLRIL